MSVQGLAPRTRLRLYASNDMLTLRANAFTIAEDAPSEQLFENPQNENTKKFLAAVLSHE